MNVLAIIVAAVLNMVIGAVWYSPVLFAKQWMKLTGKKMEPKSGAQVGYGIAALASILMAFVLALFVNISNVTSMVDGMKVGFWAWLGFVATSSAASYVFESRPKNLYLINVGYVLVALVVMGAVIGAWR